MPLSAGFLLLASDFVRWPEKINCVLLIAVKVAASAHYVSGFFKWRRSLYSTNKRSIFICYHAPQRNLAVGVYPPKRIKNKDRIFLLVMFFFVLYFFLFFLIYSIHSECAVWKVPWIVQTDSISVDWEILVAIDIHFPSSFTPLCLQIFSYIRFNSSAFYFVSCNALIINHSAA